MIEVLKNSVNIDSKEYLVFEWLVIEWSTVWRMPKRGILITDNWLICAVDLEWMDSNGVRHSFIKTEIPEGECAIDLELLDGYSITT